MENTAKITKSINDTLVHKEWFVVDAAGKNLGRFASQVAFVLRGKHRPFYTPHVDAGDYVIVINADKIVIHDRRAEKKEYFHYTGFPGGDRYQSYKSMILKKPAFVIEHAVKGMLPKTKLGRKIMKNLKVYAGAVHPHAAQMPRNFELPY